MTHSDVAGAWTLAGARQTRGGKWAVTLSRPVDPATTLGELVAALAEATPRAYEAVITLDLKRRDRAATATLYVRDADEAKTVISDHRGPVTIHES